MGHPFVIDSVWYRETRGRKNNPQICGFGSWMDDGAICWTREHARAANLERRGLNVFQPDLPNEGAYETSKWRCRAGQIGLKIRKESWLRDEDLGNMSLKRLDEAWGQLSCQEREGEGQTPGNTEVMTMGAPILAPSASQGSSCLPSVISLVSLGHVGPEHWRRPSLAQTS